MDDLGQNGVPQDKVEDAATSKYHKGNNTHSYAVGARVVCARVGGGYVVLCSIS